MKDSKQLALEYLMDSCDDMASACEKNLKALDRKKTLRDLEKNFGNLLASIKEVIEEYKLDETKVFAEVEKSIEKRKEFI